MSNVIGFAARPMNQARVLVSVLMLAGPLWQAPAAQHGDAAGPPVDVSKLGPQVGQQVPDFNLKDQNGKVWSRESIMGPKGAMLVFFRSADW